MNTKSLRRTLLLGSSIAVAGLGGYGRPASANCSPSSPGSATYLCSGVTTSPQTITIDNATVSTLPGFSIDTSGTAGDAIEITGGGDLSFTDANQSLIRGRSNGLYVSGGADNGSITIDVTGAVTGVQRYGIYAKNSPLGTGLSVTAREGSTITGNERGIMAENAGQGALEITVDGEVKGTNVAGILARNFGTDLTVTTGEESRVESGRFGILASSLGTGTLEVTADGEVTGGSYGIIARHYGKGALEVTARGKVTGNDYHGIYAVNSNLGTNLTVTTDAGSEVTGGRNGISARGNGSGNLVIEVGGYVRGDGFGVGNFGGINAIAKGDTALRITTGASSHVKGEGDGIFARSYSSAGMTIDVDGRVSSVKGAGIRADMEDPDGSGDVMVTARAQSDVTGQYYGMRVSSNSLSGDISVRSGGSVTGTKNYGISVRLQTSISTGDVEVTTDEGSTTIGGKSGIFANNTGHGALNVVVDGSVVGQTYDGISASLGNANTAGMSITTGAGSSVWGQGSGINAFTQGAGPIDISIGGDVSGDSVAVSASSAGPITLNITGNVFNSSGLVSDQVISLDRGPTATYNAGTITGYVLMSFWDDTFVNSGTWRSTGDNDFSAGDNEVSNTSTGLIDTGGNAGSSDTTNFIGVTRFINAGTFSMVDQSAGDGSTAFDTTTLDGDFKGEGGTLAIDAFLGGPGSAADQLTVKGNSSGTTFVAINNTNGSLTPPDPDGILFATVEGTSAASDFAMLGGPLNTGLYAYDVFYDDTGPDGQFFLKGFAGLGTFEVAAVVSGSQSIFFDTTASWSERQNQLRDWNARRGVVVAVADPPVAEDVSETGLWLSLRGTTAERDAQNSTEAFGKSYAFDTGYDQTTWSLMGGADFGVSMGEGSLLFGVLAGYFNSAQDLNASDTEIDYEGGSVGAYATFLSNGFFASLLGKADFMGIDYSPAGGPEESTDGTNLGLRADAGYRFSLGAAYLEPVASLAAVWTSIDDFELYNSTAEPGTNDAVQLGGGARFGWETASFDLSVTGRVWDAMGSDNEVGLVVPGTGLDTVTDAGFDGVFGEVSGQAAYRLTARVAANLSASYLFNEDQTALSGAAGVSVSR